MSEMTFNAAFDLLLGHEGGYSNHPDDPGKETMWGITERVARANGYKGAMRDLPVNVARTIAKRAYWDTVRADEMPDALRFDLFDAGYNSGPSRAIIWLQRALGVTADGNIGPETMNAIACANPETVARKFNGHRLRFMADLSTWSSFGRGWARRVADNLMRG